VNTLAAEEAGRIGEAFLFVRDLFQAPGPEQWARFSAPEIRTAWKALAERFDIPKDVGLPAAAAAYETSFIAAFDAGAPHPPVPLIESHYNKGDPVPRILHENVLFYRSFGLRLRESRGETSDHLRHQLEFVGHLYGMEAEELCGRNDPDVIAQIRAGRREFLERHLMTWLPRAAQEGSRAPEPWIANFVAMAHKLAAFALLESSGGPQ